MDLVHQIAGMNGGSKERTLRSCTRGDLRRGNSVLLERGVRSSPATLGPWKPIEAHGSRLRFYGYLALSANHSAIQVAWEESESRRQNAEKMGEGNSALCGERLGYLNATLCL